MDRKIGDVGGFEDQIRAEGNPLSAKRDLGDRRALAGGELPALVEFAVIRQIGLRRDRQDASAQNGDGAVEKTPIDPQRRAHDRHGRE
jgi:hypothetical protein